jgi:hypothetical protein
VPQLFRSRSTRLPAKRETFREIGHGAEGGRGPTALVRITYRPTPGHSQKAHGHFLVPLGGLDSPPEAATAPRALHLSTRQPVRVRSPPLLASPDCEAPTVRDANVFCDQFLRPRIVLRSFGCRTQLTAPARSSAVTTPVGRFSPSSRSCCHAHRRAVEFRQRICMGRLGRSGRSLPPNRFLHIQGQAARRPTSHEQT